MKKLTSLLIGCSLALAGVALAQQPVEQQSPSKGKHSPEKTHAPQAQPRPNAAKPETSAPKQRGVTKERGATSEPGAMKEHGAANQPSAGKGKKGPESQQSATTPETNVSRQREGAPTPRTKQQAEEHRKGMKTPAPNAKGQPKATPATAGAKPTAAPPAPASPAGQANVQANAGAKAKKPDPQKVQQIKSQHANFRAQPKPPPISSTRL